MTTPVPSPEVSGLAARHGLGTLRAVFAPKRLSRWIYAAHLFNTLYLSLLFLVPGLLYYWWQARRHPDFSRRQSRKRLHLFEGGMVVDPPSGSGPVVLTWDSLRLQQDITQLVINGRPAPTRYVYTASAPGQGSVRITEFYEDPGTWGPWMQEAVLAAQGPAVLKTLQEGGTVPFGVLALSRAGLSAPGKGRLPWPEVEEVRVSGGLVFVTRAGDSARWSHHPVKEITNLHLFLAAVSALRGETDPLGDA
ncbi:DUF6585 family protein [Streptomyces griseoruber]|uniref:DUF6585 family protein n=1 Tax=Streptomyces griseoruber TaxID=1943 RepID=UPI0037B7632E